MPALLTPFDKAICDSRRLALFIRRPTAAGGASEGRHILFQFPPRIVNDSRGGEWKEESAGPSSGDIIAIYKNANPRTITMEWNYVVGYAGWTIAKIKNELKTLRGYYRNPFIEGDDEKTLSPLVIELLLWDIGGDEYMSFRMKNTSIKHGKTLVGTKPDKIFPMYTEVSIELYSWPKIGNPPVQTVPGQKVFEQDWF